MINRARQSYFDFASFILLQWAKLSLILKANVANLALSSAPKAAIVKRFDFIIESTVICSIYRVLFMTSRPPDWCPKSMKRRPCWCLKPILWEINPFLLLKLIFAPIILYLIFRTRDWICSIRPTKVQDRDSRKAAWPVWKRYRQMDFLCPTIFFGQELSPK